MGTESLLVILIVGLVAGWLASVIVRGGGMGLIGDLLVGLVGALIGTWLLPRLHIDARQRNPCRNHRRHDRCDHPAADPPRSVGTAALGLAAAFFLNRAD